jgi:hypothetical protein
MATKVANIIDVNSCWNRAENNEPVFVLRSSDRLAPDVIVMWANKYVESKGGWLRMSPAQQAKFCDALATAAAMRNWREKEFIDDDIPF